MIDLALRDGSKWLQQTQPLLFVGFSFHCVQPASNLLDHRLNWLLQLAVFLAEYGDVGIEAFIIFRGI